MDSRFVPLMVIIPMATAFTIPLLSRIWQRFADLAANVACAALLSLAGLGAAYIAISKQAIVYRMGGWAPQLGIVLVYDNLTALVVLAVNVIAFCAILFAVRFLDSYTGRWKFYTLFMLVLAGLNGVAVTGDMFNLFVFFEISAVASYALVAFGTDFEELEAGFKYMVIGEIGGTAILLAIALMYAHVSTLNMAVVSQSLALAGRTPLFWFMVATFLIGFAVKMAMVPFHAWLPDVYPSAPAPVTTLLAGVFSKVLGVYAMSRVLFNVFGLTRANAPGFYNVLIGFGVLSIAVGGLLAFAQKDQKRLLAYSSISQVGYILIGLGIGNYWGIVGALFHIVAHAAAKGGLFLSTGAVERETGSRDIEQLRGLEKTMPATAWSYIISAFSLAGMPPLAGFFSKVFVIIGAINAGMHWLAVFAALFSVVTLGYLMRVVNKVMFLRPGEEPTRSQESPATMVAAMLVMVLISLAAGIGFKPVLDWLVGPAAQVLLNGAGYAATVLGG